MNAVSIAECGWRTGTESRRVMKLKTKLMCGIIAIDVILILDHIITTRYSNLVMNLLTIIQQAV
jgi:hypothetical protein